MRLRLLILFSIFILLNYSCGTVSSIHRPGLQKNTKGILNNLNEDTLHVSFANSFSYSFEDRRRRIWYGAENEFEQKVSQKIYYHVNEYLKEKKINFVIDTLSADSVQLVTKIIENIDSNIANTPKAIEYKFKSNYLLLYFNFNVENHLGYSTLGPAGQTYRRNEITSHALYFDNWQLSYKRGNFASVSNLSFVEHKLYSRSVSRVLKDAFK